ncbi:hypothetical protein [Pedobacter steynii]|uniref:Uncharacterized protein n=1 Tax=Pedobacter steynii TaxID=430522 RepID=A0A1D7QN22_9SPHI|nr:hypothetical protein [Pedobacter steynii]AOM80029.1 hypothetical protein BFS30_24425 [Pedobacter steynii]
MASEREKVANLVEFLSSIGFHGERLEQGINKLIELNPVGFRLDHKVQYGEETMFFELQFKKDRQFNAYRLEQYNARHRKAINIESTVINGINTDVLELRMQGLDWETYFKAPDTIAPAALRNIEDAKEMLSKLSSSQNFDGMKIRDALMFKYWPESAFAGSLSNYDDFRQLYEGKRDFHAGESGICNCNDAYMHVSGKFEDLHEKLLEMKLDEYAGVDTYDELTRLLADNPDSFEIKCANNNSEAYAEFLIPVTKTDGSYSIDEYTVSLQVYPDIEYGIYNGVNTLELEKAMQAVDWSKDGELFVLHEDREPEFYPEVEQIQQKMYQLEQDEQGEPISYLLQLKYWQYTSCLESFIQPGADQLMDSLPKIERRFPCELDAGIAWNLLCGRAVLDKNVYPFLPEAVDWLRLDRQQYTGERNLAFTEVGGLSAQELGQLIRQMPIFADRSVQYRLERGDLVPVTLNNQNKILLQANPEQKTIDVFTTERRPIPVNLNFDPDWKPVHMPSDGLQNQQEQSTRRQIKLIADVKGVKRKGKGI